MDPETEEVYRKRREAGRKRSLTYCDKCGGTLSQEMPHPLGGNLIVLQCSACGNEKTLVKENGEYKKPGRRPKRFTL